jgi:hypothetical protein
VLLVAPAGRAVAIHAALIVLITHLVLGPSSAGQRDFLMSIPALAAALASTVAAENRGRALSSVSLLLTGVFAAVAASIKPTALLLLALPAVGMGDCAGAKQVPPALTQASTYPSLRAAAAMQQALQLRLPPGAPVQMLDSEGPAFLAMARAGMRQATPHIQWFSLLVSADSVRRAFVAALAADPPAAILLTNSQWPLGRGFEAWPEFAALLRTRYVLDRSDDDGLYAWRLYLQRPLSGAQDSH